MNKIYLLIKEVTDFHNIFGIYTDFSEASDDYYNLIKYREVEKDELHLYCLETNKFYKDENFIEIDM